MGSPNSSYAWIQFMAHLLSLGQLDAARAVAERALATINFRCNFLLTFCLFYCPRYSVQSLELVHKTKLSKSSRLFTSAQWLGQLAPHGQQLNAKRMEQGGGREV